MLVPIDVERLDARPGAKLPHGFKHVILEFIWHTDRFALNLVAAPPAKAHIELESPGSNQVWRPCWHSPVRVGGARVMTGATMPQSSFATAGS